MKTKRIVNYKPSYRILPCSYHTLLYKPTQDMISYSLTHSYPKLLPRQQNVSGDFIRCLPLHHLFISLLSFVAPHVHPAHAV